LRLLDWLLGQPYPAPRAGFGYENVSKIHRGATPVSRFRQSARTSLVVLAAAIGVIGGLVDLLGGL